MSDVWYAKKVNGLDEHEINDIQSLLDAGILVSLTDDVDYFADELGIDLNDIKMVA
jgi:hypothetical protein